MHPHPSKDSGSMPSVARSPRTARRAAAAAGVRMARRPHPAVGHAADVLAGIAIPIALGTPTTGTLAAGDIVFYQVNPTAEGKLVAQVHAGGVAMRLSLLNGQDQVLMQSDGQSPANPDALIDRGRPGGARVPRGGKPRRREHLHLDDLLDAIQFTVSADSDFRGVTVPAALVAGDFNGDGRTDLAVANSGSNDVSVLLGNGDGTFQPQVTYAVGSEPVAIVAGDFNGDGRTDLAVANSGSTTTCRCCWATATAPSSPR